MRSRSAKRADLIKQLSRAARTKGLRLELVRSQGGHDLYEIDGIRLAIPRHRDIQSGTADSLRKRMEPKLGKRWWK